MDCNSWEARLFQSWSFLTLQGPRKIFGDFRLGLQAFNKKMPEKRSFRNMTDYNTWLEMLMFILVFLLVPFKWCIFPLHPAPQMAMKSVDVQVAWITIQTTRRVPICPPRRLTIYQFKATTAWICALRPMPSSRHCWAPPKDLGTLDMDSSWFIRWSLTNWLKFQGRLDVFTSVICWRSVVRRQADARVNEQQVIPLQLIIKMCISCKAFRDT